jgi:hypothetical protein
MTQLVLEIAYRHSAIKTPDNEAVLEQMWMDAMPVFPALSWRLTSYVGS